MCAAAVCARGPARLSCPRSGRRRRVVAILKECGVRLSITFHLSRRQRQLIEVVDLAHHAGETVQPPYWRGVQPLMPPCARRAWWHEGGTSLVLRVRPSRTGCWVSGHGPRRTAGGCSARSGPTTAASAATSAAAARAPVRGHKQLHVFGAKRRLLREVGGPATARLEHVLEDRRPPCSSPAPPLLHYGRGFSAERP